MICYLCDRKIPEGVYNPCPECRDEFGITSEIKDGDLKVPEGDPDALDEETVVLIQPDARPPVSTNPADIPCLHCWGVVDHSPYCPKFPAAPSSDPSF